MLIIVLVSGILIILFVARLPEKLCNGEVQACRTSVLAATVAEKLGIDIPNSCPQSNKRAPYVFRREKPEEINRLISREFEKCVFKFHEGRLDLGERGGKVIFGVNHCFICAEFKFGNDNVRKAYRKANSDGNTLIAFMRREQIQCARPKVSFLDYLGRIGSGEFEHMEVTMDKDILQKELDPSKDYVIMLGVYKEPKLLDLGETYYGWAFGNVQIPAEVVLTTSDTKFFTTCELLFQ